MEHEITTAVVAVRRGTSTTGVTHGLHPNGGGLLCEKPVPIELWIANESPAPSCKKCLPRFVQLYPEPYAGAV